MVKKEGDYFILATKSSSYIFRILDTGHPDHVHYGRRIDDLLGIEHVSEPFSLALTAVPYLDEEHPSHIPARFLYEYSTPGAGDSRESALIIDYENGMETLTLLYRSYRIFCGKDSSFPSHALSGEGTETLEIELSDAALPIRVFLYYTVYEDEDVILRSAKVRNETGLPIKLKSVSSLSLDFPFDDFSLISFDGAWGRERKESEKKLGNGITIIDSKTGTSSNEHSPLVFLKRGNGEIYGFNLIYSGNHRELVEVSPFGKTRIITGINPYAFEWILNDGEDFVTPEAIMTYSSEGEDEAALNFHAFVNRYIIRGVWKDRERPILINSWETSYFDLSEEKLLALADQASSLGFELFVLDDGWFSSRRDDKRGLGDWYVSKEVFPHGLASFSRKIKSKGLMFGLWVEPEMVNQDSDLYRRHPEWVVSIPGRTACVTRHQYLLDLSHPDVRAYLFDVLSEVFTQADVDYVKWDFNRTITDYYSLNPEMNCMGEFMHRYILGLYELLGRITTRFENVLFESCASGGNRYDLGMLTFMPQTWTSDNTDLYHRISIQQGTLRGFPPSTMACHVSASPAHQSLRQSLIESRFDVACFGVLGYELDLKSLGALELEAVRGQISFYKRYRRIFQFGQFRPLKITNPYSHWWSISLDDITIVLEFVYRNMPNTGRCDRLIIPYLKKDRRYRVSSRKMRIPKEFFGSLYPGYGREESEEYSILVSGDILISSGIALPPQFMGNGVSPLMRVIGDNGSRMYVIEEIREKASS